MRVTIARAKSSDLCDWGAMLHALWCDTSAEDHAEEAAALLVKPSDSALNLIARDEHRSPVAFAEASIRREYVNGCSDTPVAFLEGIWVTEVLRRQGLARDLLIAVQDWARSYGMHELASDTDSENLEGIAWHGNSGFEETERVIFFSKRL